MDVRDGRAQKAAKLHMLRQKENRQRTARELVERACTSYAEVAKADYWTDRGKSGRWVRVHTAPRSNKFNPWRVPRGPGRKTRLQSIRSTHGVDSSGMRLLVEDHSVSGVKEEESQRPWMGKTIILVDGVHTDEWGTDQRRQREQARIAMVQ